jgi:tRNA threonylcarbamoyl adenosine modification protein YeaZ
MVDEMLREIGGCARDLGAIVVGIGPGTFTGVRIAVATARALSLALSVPVVGVSTLGALAAGAAADLAGAAAPDAGPGMARGVQPGAIFPCRIVPVVDARRDQVFFGLYEAAEGVGGAGVVARGGAPGGCTGRRWERSAAFGVCDREALVRVVTGPALVVAEEQVLIGELPVGMRFAAAEVKAELLVLGQELLAEPGETPQGWRLAPWLAAALANGAPAMPEAVKPIYVRSPDADTHITKMKNPWADGPGGRFGSAAR